MFSCGVVVLFLQLSLSSKNALGDQGVLLERVQADVGWTWPTAYKLGSGIGWRRDVATGSYTVCDLVSTQTNHTNSWQVSEFIESQGAKEVNIELVFTARQCPGGYAYCVQYLNLFVLEANTALSGGVTQNLIEKGNFKFVQKMTALSVWTSGQTPVDNIINTTFLMTSNGLYVGFQDVGACIAVSRFAVRYNYCATESRNGVTYYRTIAPSTNDRVTQVKGNCSSNAVTFPWNSVPYANCSASGDWVVTDPSYACLCKAGFEPLGNVCQGCPVGKYKGSHGNTQCSTCPDHTHSNATRDTCTCEPGYYRAPADPPQGKCTAPPTKPRNLTVAIVSSGVVIVTWQQPIDNDSHDDVTYDVTCHKCINSVCDQICNDVTIQPSNQRLVKTHVIITITGSYSTFKVTVFAKNGVSDVAGPDWLRNESIVFSSLPATLSFSTTDPISGGEQVAMAIGVSVAVTFVVCFLVSALVVFCLSKKWKPKVSNGTTEPYFKDSSSTIETELNQSINGGHTNEAFFIECPAKTNGIPKINVLEMDQRRDSLQPHNGSSPGHHERRGSREAWSTAPPKPRRHSKGIMQEEVIGSSVSVRSWFPENEIQYNI